MPYTVFGNKQFGKRQYSFFHTYFKSLYPSLYAEMLNNIQERGKQYEGPMRVRIVPATGAEKFAEFIYHKLNKFVKEETNGRVKVGQVEFMEHNKNSAIYTE